MAESNEERRREQYGLCNGREQEREIAQHLEERERERNLGEKKKRVGLVTVINWDPQELSPDLNPA